jgi:GNAT superfamily N-acetyltransferase
VLIRQATDADLDAVVRLRLAFIADLRDLDPASFDPAFVAVTRAFVEDVVARGRIRTWLADPAPEPGRADVAVAAVPAPIGLVSVLLADTPPLPEEHRAREGYLINMYVEPAARHRGVASALLDEVRAAAPALGLRRIYLHATEQGRPLYERSGFSPDARWMGLPLPPP